MRALGIAAKLRAPRGYSWVVGRKGEGRRRKGEGNRWRQAGHPTTLRPSSFALRPFSRLFFACITPPNPTRLPPPIQCKDFPQLWKTCGLSDRYRLPPSMNLWRQVLDRLEQVVEKTEYDTWFAPTR